MAEFQQQLQTQGAIMSPSPQPSAAQAVAGAVSQGLSLFSDIQSMRQEEALAKQKIASAQQEQMDELLINDVSIQLSEGWQARSDKPAKANEWLRTQTRELTNKYGATVAGSVLERFEKQTGVNPYRSKNELQQEQSEIDTRLQEQQQQLVTNTQFAFENLGSDPVVRQMIDADGNIKDGYTVEQVAARGEAIKMQRQARLASLQSRRDLAKTEKEAIEAEAAIELNQTIPMMSNELVGYAKSLEGMPVKDAITQLDEQYNNIIGNIQRLNNFTVEGRKQLAETVETTYNIWRKRLSGQEGVVSREFVNGVVNQNIIQTAQETDPSVRVMFAVNQAGIRPSEAMVDAANTGLITQVMANPHAIPKKDGEGNPLPEQATTNSGRTVEWGKVVTESYIDNITLLEEPSTEVIPSLGKSQADIIAERLVVGMSPRTTDEKKNFFGRDGLYLGILNKWNDPEVVEKYTPNVLSRGDVKESFVLRNGEATQQYLQRIVSQRTGGDSRSDLVGVDMSKGYPQFTVQGEVNQPRPRNVPLYRGRTMEEQLQVDLGKLNKLFRLQYEAATNYGNVIGDSDMARDTVAQQMNAIANYGLVSSSDLPTVSGR